jgi:hypothetical protein
MDRGYSRVQAERMPVPRQANLMGKQAPAVSFTAPSVRVSAARPISAQAVIRRWALDHEDELRAEGLTIARRGSMSKAICERYELAMTGEPSL